MIASSLTFLLNSSLPLRFDVHMTRSCTLWSTDWNSLCCTVRKRARAFFFFFFCAFWTWWFNDHCPFLFFLSHLFSNQSSASQFWMCMCSTQMARFRTLNFHNPARVGSQSNCQQILSSLTVGMVSLRKEGIDSNNSDTNKVIIEQARKNTLYLLLIVYQWEDEETVHCS